MSAAVLGLAQGARWAGFPDAPVRGALSLRQLRLATARMRHCFYVAQLHDCRPVLRCTDLACLLWMGYGRWRLSRR